MILHDVLLTPMMTEKSTFMRQKGQYTFLVNLRANKVLVKQAVEKLFKVKVEGVSILNQKPKAKFSRNTRKKGRSVARKKAIVRLQSGTKIAEMEV